MPSLLACCWSIWHRSGSLTGSVHFGSPGLCVVPTIDTQYYAFDLTMPHLIQSMTQTFGNLVQAGIVLMHLGLDPKIMHEGTRTHGVSLIEKASIIESINPIK